MKQPAPDAAIAPFLDSLGRLKQWPHKFQKQLAATAYLATKIPPDTRFTERELGIVLAEWHTFNDSCALRRALCDHGFLDRTADGSAYWRVCTADK